jgi:hypothetical protein
MKIIQAMADFHPGNNLPKATPSELGLIRIILGGGQILSVKNAGLEVVGDLHFEQVVVNARQVQAQRQP